jgi:hypothetical protein
MPNNRRLSFDRSSAVRVFGALAVLATALACGAKQQKPAGEAEPSGESSGITAPPPQYEFNVTKEEEPVDAGPQKAEPPPPEPEPQKRTQPKFSSETEIETIVGESGAMMSLGTGAKLHVPDGALRDGITLRFAVGKAPAKGAPPKSGEVYVLSPATTSKGAPFELTLPLPPDVAAVELVVAVPGDPKAKPPTKPSFKTVAAKSADPKSKVAIFELAELPGGDVYLTPKK